MSKVKPFLYMLGKGGISVLQTALFCCISFNVPLSIRKISVPRDVRNLKIIHMTSSGENGLNTGSNTSRKWDRTRCPGE